MERFDWKATIKVNILVLKSVGLWPNSDDLYGFNLYTLYSLICINVFINCHNFFQTFNILFILDDLKALIATIFVSLTDCMSSMKAYYFIKNVAILKNLMLVLDNETFQPRNQRQRQVIQADLIRWKRFYIVYLIPVLLTLCMWALFPILDGSVKVRRLPFLAWYPYNEKITPLYQLTYIYQMLSISFIAFANMNMDTMIAALMVYIGTQCEILNDNLRNLQAGSYNDDLIECVQHHRIVLSFAKESNRFLNNIVLGQFFTSAVAIGLTMFQLSVVTPFTSEFYSLLFYAGAVLMQIFLYCWFGNEVIAKSSKIPLAAFESDWINTPISVQKNLVFFIRKAQKPIVMEAQNLFAISIQTFMKILQSAWSYFALLHQVNSKSDSA